ncbi:MAG: glycosyltransferase family 2 protein, partial [Candidatus Altiarchaeota archaeon]|nr:glycosyltransferase family 2 protein [Candidatus Altiarchaeota archaeon]
MEKPPLKKPPLISIIIPAYNRLGYLEKCLESIKLQKFKNYEIIVVDDCSTENLSGVAAFCDKYVLNNINMGPSYSKNLGALNSSGEILLFLDSDVVLLPGSLEKLPEIFKSDVR